MTSPKTPMEEMREMEKEQIEIAVSRRFIDDNNYSKKEKDIFIEFIRNLARKEAEEKQKEFIEKVQDLIFDIFGKECCEKVVKKRFDKISKEVFGGSNGK
jgi:predicted AlkP superfamily phosphohydrolase/phosphomutase